MTRNSQETSPQSVKWGSFWSIMSILAHVAAICAVIYFSPLRDYLFSESDADALDSIHGSRFRRIVNEILAADAERLRKRIAEQRAILNELQGIRDRAYGRYKDQTEWLAKQNAKAPPVEALSTLGAAGPDAGAALQGKRIVALYNIARNIEITTFGTYRQIRAIELSRIQRISLKGAYEVAEVEIPKHPDADPVVLSQSITNATDGKLDALKAEIAKIRAEVASMVAAGQRMLDMARGLIGDDVGGTLATLGAAGGATMGDDSSLRLDDPFVGYSPPSFGHQEHDWGRGVGPIIKMPDLFPRKDSKAMGPRPAAGRKLLAATTKRADWMYVDAWYIIGPFSYANPDKREDMIDQKFPPETGMASGIDLDAVYVRQYEDNRGLKRLAKLRWEFRKSQEPCVIPHIPRNWSIWYAYTEIYCDRDQERFCMFGSDDYGKAWINGKGVYGSGKTPHPWIPDRRYKKVKFKKGFNPVFFKLENAWGRTGFSMCIYLGEI